MIVNICATWLKFDVVAVVAHASHSWDFRKYTNISEDGIEEEDAEPQSVKFWERLTHALAQRPLPHCPLLFVGDANIDLSHLQACYQGVGEHQAAREATSYALFVGECVGAHQLSLLATLPPFAHITKDFAAPSQATSASDV